MSANNSQFIQTRNMFRDYLSGYPKDLTYDAWKNAEPEDQAALLYITFYQEITLAWCNAVVSRKVVHVTQEDGVSTVLQYLMKNVDKILEDEKRYSQRYVYTVCYNCLLSLWRTRGADMQRSSLEIPNEYTEGDVSVNLWDLVPSEDDDLETQETKEAVWNIIRHMGPKAEKVVNNLINPGDSLHKISKSSSERPIDRLADVSVSSAEYDAILEELRTKLLPFKDILFTF